MPAKQRGADGAAHHSPQATAPRGAPTVTDQDGPAPHPPQPTQTTPQRDYAQELTATLTQALERHSRAESAIVSSMRQRAELYEGAFVQAKQARIDRTAAEAPPPARRARQQEALKADIQTLPEATLRSLAALDARHYRALRDPQRQAEAALILAETTRLDGGYRVALTAQAPDLAHVVQLVAAATDNVRTTNAPVTHSAPSNTHRRQAEDPSPTPTLTLDRVALEQVATKRAHDFTKAAKQLGLNGIERDGDLQLQQRKKEQEQIQAPSQASASSTPAISTNTKPPAPAQARTVATNRLTADEVFTASKDETKPIVPADIESKYLRVGNKYYHPKNTNVVAFIDRGNQLQTRSDSEQIATTLVAIARARGWDEIKVSGSETFRQEVWREASAHGMHVKGYTPTEIDKAELAKRSTQSLANQFERGDKPRAPANAATTEPKDAKPHQDAPISAPVQNPTSETSQNRQRAQAFERQSPTDALKAHPELAGAYASQALMAKKAAADGLSPEQSAIVMARVQANLVNCIARGELPQVKLREQTDVRHDHTKQRNQERKVER